MQQQLPSPVEGRGWPKAGEGSGNAPMLFEKWYQPGMTGGRVGRGWPVEYNGATGT